MAEVLIAAGLLGGVVAAYVAVAAVGLLGLFALAMSVNLVLGRRVGCGCLGVAEDQQISWLTVGRNLLLMLGAAVVATVPAGTVTAGRSTGALTVSEVWGLAVSAALLVALSLVAGRAAAVLRLVARVGGTP